ncbi:hypothetical protein W97_05321 [Coniosporium apollinis CBS 100218]|uniref:Nudix hydrolase domain-containing protein n=1 Tax=Coniosporium apollinis (strain CBS 100218) TaxID=1168221 RepID=R7YW60_CONA1|nr:uncharacterized protein W97_05321 [Coniosporium apollinis CBS 100218]EON66078.1 hypothetical protein W97_05321 [Coniosporium apollinis CBS 100218]
MSPEAETVTSAQEPFLVPPELVHLSIPLKTFQEQHPDIQGLVIGALVYCGDRLLLLQRSASDSYPNRWEVPGGSCDLEDETVLHAVARELFEETGLRATRIVRQVGDGVSFQTGRPSSVKNWLKLSFEVEVASGDLNGQADAEGKFSNQAYQGFPVKLDPAEHQRFIWVKEEELRQKSASGLPLSFISVDQVSLMLVALGARNGYDL